MLNADPTFDEDMVEMIALPDRAPDDNSYPTCFYTEPCSYIRHPVLDVPYSQLFPYDTDTPKRALTRDSPTDVEGLPESEWYRPSSSKANTISVRNPAAPEARPLKVVDTEFWRFITLHEHTHSIFPLPEAVYEQRAADLYLQLQEVPKTDASDKKSWACPRELMRIIVDEAACTAELFSHFFNSSWLLGDHYSDLTGALSHGRLARAAVHYDGFGTEAFAPARSVYGNPPYDPALVRKLKTRVVARAQQSPDFRAVLVIPMDSAEEEQWEGTPHCSVVASFPPGALPFVPAGHWRGERQYCSGSGYAHATSRVVIALCDSSAGALGALDLDRFRARLAKWYVGVAPFECLRPAVLGSTRLGSYITPITEKTVYNTYPADWKFWDPLVRRALPDVEPYHGGLADSYSVHGTPYRNVVAHQPLVAMLGSLPDLFGRFLLGQGHAPDKLAAVTSRVRSRLLCHLKRRWLTYQRLVRTAVPPCSRPGVLGGHRVVPGGDFGDEGEGSDGDGDAPADGSWGGRRGRTLRSGARLSGA